VNRYANVDMDDINAALHLEGLSLPGGWVVGKLNTDAAQRGTFSISYEVRHETGRSAFLKVLDLIQVFGNLEALSAALNDYLAERDLLILCGEERMSRVVVALDHGQVTLDGFMPPLSTVHYIIFELADSDLNRVLSSSESTDLVVRIDLLHNLAVGLKQLHSRKVAHQDIKPANSLVFHDTSNRDVAKIGDLGRAFQDGTATSHDSDLVPGDRSFAPPEQLYGYEFRDRAVRRFSADLYQFGSLICYTFSGVTMNGLLAQQLDPAHHWDRFSDGYEEAMPYLLDAFSQVLENLNQTLPNPAGPELSQLIAALCNPDAEKRGHPQARRGHGSIYSLERIVALLSLASVRAKLNLRRTA
jgi:serine/threonine protein kinase